MSTLNTLRTSGPYFTGEESLPYIREVEIGYTIDEMKTIKTGESEFERLIKSDSLYVDKSMYIHLLLRMGQSYYFAARPRRYGKSLFCSTLQALFEGRSELFEGLYIAEKTDYSFESFPVLHFNFATLSVTTLEEFLRTFSKAVYGESVRLGLTIERSLNPADMLQDILYALGTRAVVIIDEYDAPLVKAITEGKQFLSDMRSYFRDFYSRIKNNGRYIRFFFITGVTKYPSLSIFSEMNNLTDISMDPRFASAFGYTEDELLSYFDEAIDEHYEENRDRYGSRDELVERIREYYDGYRFSPDTEITVYNPVSIGRFFNNGCTFDNYWDQTGVSSLAVKLASSYPLYAFISGECSAGKSAFNAFDIASITGRSMNKDNIAALLYYTGYLTLCTDTEDEEGNKVNGAEDGFLYFLRFPNREVASSFAGNLLSRYAKDDMFIEHWFSSFIRAAAAGDEEALKKKLDEYFSAFSYELMGGDRERSSPTVFHAIFIMAGLYAVSEDRGPAGRSDEVLLTGRHIWIFELKTDRSADEALRQIEEKRYRERFSYLMRPGMVMHSVGISFSTSERRIAEWKSASL